MRLSPRLRVGLPSKVIHLSRHEDCVRKPSEFGIIYPSIVSFRRETSLALNVREYRKTKTYGPTRFSDWHLRLCWARIGGILDRIESDR